MCGKYHFPNLIYHFMLPLIMYLVSGNCNQLITLLKQILSLAWQTILYLESAWPIVMAAGPVQIDQDH